MKKCNACGREYEGYSAISRLDNETEICASCGNREAVGIWVNHAFLEKRKKEYPAGTRILLISMGGDIDPIEPYTKGTVEHVDDIGTVHCKFDNGRQLGVIPGVDIFRKIDGDEDETN